MFQKYFNSAAILAYFVLPAAGVFPVNFPTNLYNALSPGISAILLLLKLVHLKLLP